MASGDKGSSVQPVAVFRSLGQVLGTLTSEKVLSLPQIQHILGVAVQKKIIVERNGNYEPTPAMGQQRDPKSPFIVIEGMDGSGKTTLTEYLRSTLNLKLMSTPPASLTSIPNLRPFFEEQSEEVKRAYYSIGNYIVAKEVLESSEPVIMDRFWHSTAAYAYSHLIRTGVIPADQIRQSDLTWPDDLLKPNLVLYLTVSEAERKRRHTNRENFTNTKEEQILADDGAFRANLNKCYHAINGVQFEDVDADGQKYEAKERILNTVLKHFPELKPEIRIQNTNFRS